MSFREKMAAKQIGHRTKNFVWDEIGKSLPVLQRVDGPDGRRYVTPDGNAYPSVTTVIGATEDKSFLDDWRDRVGIKEANKITTQSARRGTALHDICEKYLQNKADYIVESTSLMYVNFFKQIQKRLDESIDSVVATEAALFSDNLRVAGSTDLIAKYKGSYSIVDYKNARWFKKKDDIEGYFVQTAIYAMMVEELLKISVPNLVVLMAVEGNEGKPSLEFIESLDDWKEKSLEVIKSYYEKNA